MRRLPRSSPAVAFLALLIPAALSTQGGDDVVVDAAMHHLGDDPQSDWTEAPAEPEGAPLRLEFEARANAEEATLFFRQRHVDDTWTVRINDRTLGALRREKELVERFLPIPAGTLVDGTNTFVLEGDKPTDDITFGEVRVVYATLREALDLARVTVRVADADGRPSPARVTVADRAGERVPVYFAEDLHQATREGVVYTDAGEATFEVPRGDYTVYATRGPEWSLAQADLQVVGTVAVELSLDRVVDTSGFVACDTHVHTLTFSGHGDSSVEERMVTLAGEGVELAISTDHNHNTDYAPYQARMELGAHFTPVVGNEVTTPIGHFNAFPLDPDDEVPPYELRDVVQIVDGIRARGAQVVILNHPRWPNHEDGPFGAMALDHLTGANRGLWTYPFDAVELINSTTDEEAPMLLFEDWFALLNRGERVSAVGSSDSHTVGDPVGGGRTYVSSATDDPSRIDVDAACRAIVEGRTSLSMGIFVEAEAFTAGAEGRYGMGDVVPVGDGDECRVIVNVQAPDWVRPERATLFVNGEALAEFELAPDFGSGNPGARSYDVSLDGFPRQDAWAVWVVVGEGIDGPYWPLHNDYTLGATNPIFLDLDGDGVYRSPRQTAVDLVESAKDAPFPPIDALEGSWESVAMHALDVARIRAEEDARARVLEWGELLRPVHPRAADYLDALPAVR